MHDVAAFLRRHPPFDTADDEAVAAAARAATIEFFPAGTQIIRQDGQAERTVRVIRAGLVELTDQDRVLDLLGEGELVGHASMLAGAPTGLGVRAAEDALVYTIPASAIEPLLANADGVRFVARSLGRRAALRAGAHPGARATAADPADRPVGGLVRSAPVVVEPATSVREAAQRMVAAGASCALVALADGGLGIVTDRDLRTRVVAAGAAPSTPVAEVMTSPARTVPADRRATSVLLDMLQHGVRHLPVVDPTGTVLGVVADTDLVAVERRAPFRIRAAIARAPDVEAVRAAASQTERVVLDLHAVGVPPLVVSETVAAMVDASTRRLLELAELDLGAPPVPYTWFLFGSHARREGAPGSDVDSAIAWDGPDDDPGLRAWFRALATRVQEGIDRCGFPRDGHGATADNPIFARGIAEWERAIGSWIHDPTQEKAGLLVAMVADSRPVWGAAATGGRLAGAVLEARASPPLLRLLARMALAHRPPTGFVRDLVVEHDGEHRGTLDLKHGGLVPATDLARLAGLRAGVVTGSTHARLAAARAEGVLDATAAETLEEAFDVLVGLRLDHHAEQLAAGVPLDDHVDPRTLGRLARGSLRDAFRAIASAQRGVQSDLSAWTA